MPNKVALVTGANTGIGFATVKQLAELDYHTILTAPNAELGKAATQTLLDQNLPVEYLQLDITSAQSVASAAEYLSNNFSTLDVLVNNAGVNMAKHDRPRDEITFDEYDQTFAINYFGPVRVTYALLPLLKKSTAPRIVNVSSYHASLTLNCDPTSDVYDGKFGPYNDSKSALNAFTVHLAYTFRDTPLRANCVHPGWVRTDMGGNHAPMSPEEGAKSTMLMVTIPNDGPTGTFTHLGESLPW